MPKAEPASPPSAARNRFAFATATLLLIAATVLSYSNSLKGPFIFDDISAIYENPTIRDLTKLGQTVDAAAAFPPVSERWSFLGAKSDMMRLSDGGTYAERAEETEEDEGVPRRKRKRPRTCKICFVSGHDR